jgi:hypothetical protein
MLVALNSGIGADRAGALGGSQRAGAERGRGGETGGSLEEVAPRNGGSGGGLVHGE